MAQKLDFKKRILENELRVIVVEVPHSQTVTVSTIYNVGSKHENPGKTGFAHLFEHLMFGGSKNVENFDQELEQIGGFCNAFTTADYTNYYTRALASNLDILLWLESDRMLQLKLDQERLDTQKKVVSEEFNQRYLNTPYGDLFLEIFPFVFGETHLYGWPVIGKNLDHIQKAQLTDVEDFFYTFYRPNNAILAIVGGINTEEAFDLVQKWYSDIPKAKKLPTISSTPKPIKGEQRKLMHSNAPYNALTLFFNAPSIKNDDYFTLNTLIDILSGRSSAIIPYTLEKEKELCVDATVSDFELLDLNILDITAILKPNVTFEKVETEIWKILKDIPDNITQEDLDRVINNNLFSKEHGLMSNTTKANSIAFYELIDNINLINEWFDKYKNITLEDVKNLAKELFSENNYAVLYYDVEQKNKA
jgi:predicted Zn-dependent peptidase